MKKKLTPEQLAAIAAGATLEAVLASTVDTGAGAGSDEVVTSDDAQAALFAQNEALVALTAEVETLKAAKLEADTKLVEANTALEAATASLSTASAASAAMSETIMGRVKNMSIALNVTAPETCEDPVALVALHADLDEKFKAKFAAGRVSAVSNKPESKAKPSWTQGLMAAASKIQVY